MSENSQTVRATARIRIPRMPRPLHLRRILAALALPLLVACYSDVSGVRDWSIQAREAVLPIAAVRTAAVPGPTQGASLGSTRADAVLVLQEAAGAWLGALAAVADDAAPPDDGDALEARAPQVAAFDPGGAAAVVNLGRAVGYAARGYWRAPGLAYAFEHGERSFRDVMSALDRQLAALAAEAPAGADAQGMPVPADPARRAVIARVAAGHDALAARKALMAQSDTGRLMRAEASELRRLLAAGGTAAAAAAVPRGAP